MQKQKQTFLGNNRQAGFTIIELVASIFIFSVLVVGVLSSFSAMSQTVKAAREKTIVSNLAAHYLEIVRNMPFSQIGTISGNPNGTLPDLPNAYTQVINGTTYKVYYRVRYQDDAADGLAPTDTSPGDYKQVKMFVVNNTTGIVTSFLTNVSPKGLEGSNTGGSLLVNVIDSQGQPLPGVTVDITYPTTTPTIILSDITDSNGQVLEVALPAAVNNYRIVASKAGYSTDQTYPITASNPNPTKPDATIEVGKVTEVTLAIDILSTLNIRTLNEFCQNIDGVNVNVKGEKEIGIAPNVYKFDNNYTSVAGLVVLNNLEWDTYTPTLVTGQPWVIKGTSPIQQIDVNPGTTQTFSMILTTNTTANSLLVIVKDAATDTALEGATVHLRKGGSVPQDYYGITGGSVWVQSSWVGGGGHASWSTTTPTRYWQDDANIDINSAATGVRLNKTSGDYAPSGWLESSTFDTGTDQSNYTTITWAPTTQVANTNLSFQIAANNDNATWNYVGPDGTASTYYTVSGSNVSSVLDGNRYVRYKVFLATTNDKKTPVLTSIQINYVSGCPTPGQVIFTGLTAGNNYDLDVSLTGYVTEVIPNVNINSNQSIEVKLSP